MSSSGETTPLERECEDLLANLDDRVTEYLESFEEDACFELSVEELTEYDEALVVDWRENPHLFEKAVLRLLDDIDDDDQHVDELGAVRVTGFIEEDVYDVGRYSPDEVAGRTIHLRGQVTHRSKRKLRDEVVAFECQRCGTVMDIEQSGYRLQEPGECRGCDRNGPYTEVASRTVTRDYQRIRLQTLPEESKAGETEHIDLDVFDDHVGELEPGDRAVVTAEMRGVRESQNKRTKELQGTVHAITKLTADHTDVDVEPYESDIRELASGSHPDFGSPYEAVRQSVAPFHTGDERVKMAIAYQLFGGVEKELPNGKWFRGNSHILLMGDPGVGKTAIIRYVSELVPRAEYATGKKSTSAGLSATATKDEFAEGGWTLQAGTLVRANNGLAAIDELDKMDPDDRDAMMEAMSEQQITVTMIVSGVLPAKTSVLAAANPKYGTFDRSRDIGSQLDLDEVLLSRFDLWFVMRDQPDPDLDEEIARNMTQAARAGQKVSGGRSLSASERDDIDPPIPPEMFRAYVAMGKRCFPVLTEDAEDRIVEEYVQLRQVNEEGGPVPTTVRLVEAIHRLSEASARIRLADEVTVEDVERAIEVLRESLETLGVDPETGKLDAARFETGTPSSLQDRVKAVESIIEGQSTEEEAADYDSVKEEAMVIMDEEQFENALKKLTDRGEVYEPGTGKLRRV